VTTLTTHSRSRYQTQSAVPITGAHGDYALEVHPSGESASVSCEERGLFVAFDAATRQHLGHLLLEAVDSLTLFPRLPGHLQSFGSVQGTVPDHGVHRFEIDVVRDEDEQMRVVLLTCEALRIDGVLRGHPARRLGELLLQT
jgi:hypothetical protein